MSKLSIIGASAGSGKTHRIVLEILKMIIPDSKKIKHILAITFTNKAAGELKDRVIKELSLLSESSSNSKMKNELCRFLNISEDDLTVKAKNSLYYLLHHYSDISICTIDAFMQSIIRSFARDLGLSTDYEVIVDDEEMNDFIMNSIIENVNQANKKDLTETFKIVMENNLMNDSVSTNFDNYFNPILRKINDEKSISVIDRSFGFDISDMNAKMKELNTKRTEINKKINSELENFYKLVSDNNLKDLFVSKKVSILSEFEKIKKNPLKYSKIKSVNTIIESGEILKSRNEEFGATIINIYNEIWDQIKQLKYAKAISNNFPMVSIIGEMWKIRNDYIEKENLLPVADFNKKIGEVIKDEPVPFIYFRVGNRFKNIMIDEFQDTSEMQWSNLIPLVYNTLSGEHPDKTSSWIVGDPKQSIYRWRNGKMEIMLALQNLNDTKSDAHKLDNTEKNFFKKAVVKEKIGENYRSLKTIVEFNNELFKFINEKFLKNNSEEGSFNDLYEKIYEDVNQNVIKTHGGYVEIQFFDKNSESQHKSIIEIINDKEKEGYSLKDIAILCRNENDGILLSKFLLNKGIKVVSKETLKMGNSLFCKLAMCVFRCLTKDSEIINNVEVICMLKNYLNYLHTKDFLISTELEKALLEITNSCLYFDDGKNNRIKSFLQNYFSKFQDDNIEYLSSCEKFETIVDVLKLNETGKYYITFLRENIAEILTAKENSDEAVWKWWTEKGYKESIVTPQNSEAIKVMTIHKSKGLQFPVVILPKFNFAEGSNIHKDLHWVNVDEKKWSIPFSAISLPKDSPNELGKMRKDEELKTKFDMVNLAYVACTRAEEQLFILSDVSSKNTETISISKMIEDFINVEKNKFEEKTNENITKYSRGNVEKIKKTESENVEYFEIRNFYVNTTAKYSENDGYDDENLRLLAKRGQTIHQILASINKKNDIETVLLQNMINGNISAEEKEKYFIFIQGLIDKYTEIFPENGIVKNEFEIYDGKNIYRPDKLIKLENGKYFLVDFKTGSKNNDHKKQISNYSELLKSLGIEIEKKSLLYIDLLNNSSELDIVD